MTSAERRATVRADLARYFGDQAAKPLAYLEKSWGADEDSREVYGGFLAPGGWTAYGGAARADRSAPLGRHGDSHRLGFCCSRVGGILPSL